MQVLKTTSILMLLVIAGMAVIFTSSPVLPPGRAEGGQNPSASLPAAPLKDEREIHLANIKQLTFEGENAEAYFSGDGKRLIFQRATKGDGCDQIFSMNIDGSDIRPISNGKGKTTCSYYTPDRKSVIYATTALDNPECPPKPDYSLGYVWALFPSFDIVVADANGSNVRKLTNTPRYDAEATIRPDGTIVFTSLRTGDLEIYTMDSKGHNVKQLTDELGYDGGPFWSQDGKLIVYRAFHPQTDAEKADYKKLLDKDLIRPSKLDLYVMNPDGSNKRRITNNGKANFAPYFFPSNKRVIFSSNQDDPRGRNFEIYAINVDGTGLERITYNESFDGFPMFSPDGKKLVFCSNRHGAKQGDTNVFIADWVK